ncbi:MAG: type II toxin-antitoxin system VapC family toxin [Spirochaetales bacterium]|nr:type II toxin-antitoxin system VapC family toxin [Spirochaetales bacterium]
MIIDTSAVVAIVMREAGFDDVLERLSARVECALGTPTFTETAIVLSARLKRDARALLTRFLSEAGVEIVPFGEAHGAAATDAWLRYGKGRHPAALNFGDCMSYAVAKLADEPLLYVGNDFSKTDIAAA